LSRSENKIRVKTCTLDSIIEKLHIDNVRLIKIDVEGAEIEVIKGAIKTIVKHRPTIIVELCFSNIAEFVKLMFKLNYRIKVLSTGPDITYIVAFLSVNMRRALKSFLGGYRPYSLRGLRGGGGPNAVSASLIDAFAKMNLNSIKMIVLSTPFRELGIPVLRPRKLILSKNIEVHYIPLLNPLPVIIELAKSDLIHIFALEPQNIIIALLSKILRKKTLGI
jgi:hypothetical protein